MTQATYLQRQPDGSYIDWGRHGPAGYGPARWYGGEAAEVIALVVGDKRLPIPTAHSPDCAAPIAGDSPPLLA